MTVQLASDLGYGIPWLTQFLTISIVIATGFFVYVALSTKSQKVVLGGFDKAKYELNKYHAERYWAIFVAGMLIWLYFLGLPWMPPVAFSQAIQHPQNVHTIKITAGQWFWKIEDGGFGKGPTAAGPESNGNNDNKVASDVAHSSKTKAKEGTSATADNGNNNAAGDGQPKITSGETVKFVARSLDVNHGFSILSSSNSMDSPLIQMQVIPGYDNVFYYTFKKPGIYTIRCLEYCGWSHPYMISQITVV
jgi:heme/copper-type cytochrome/quinol oxidase subunit 2